MFGNNVVLLQSQTDIMALIIRSPFALTTKHTSTTPEFFPVNGSTLSSAAAMLLGKSSKTHIRTTTKEGQQDAYEKCSLISTIVNRRADMAQSGVLQIVDKDGKEVNTSESRLVMKLLKQPNPMQDADEFERTVGIYYDVFGYCPILKVYPSQRTTGLPTALWPLNPLYFGYELTGKWSLQNEISGYVKYAQYTPQNGTGEKYEGEALNNIWIFNGKTPQKNDMYTAQSQLVSLQDSINLFQVGINVYGRLIEQSVMGIIANKRNDQFGLIDDPEQKKEVQEKLKGRYGLTEGRDGFIVTNQNLMFQSLLTNVGSLAIPEGLRLAMESICDRMGFAPELLAEKDGTFENKKTAEVSQYNTQVIPYCEKYAKAITDMLGLNGIRLHYDFSGVSVLQEDDKTKADGLTAMITAHGKLYSDGMITRNQYLTAIGLPSEDNGDRFIHEITSQPLAVRIGVGGTQALQAILVDAILTPEQKRNTLIVLFGLSDAEARQIMGG